MKGKPKTEYMKYHQECKEMMRYNNKRIKETLCKKEVLRLKSLNYSLFQRLKRRRDEQRKDQCKLLINNRISMFLQVLQEYISEQDMQRIFEKVSSNISNEEDQLF